MSSMKDDFGVGGHYIDPYDNCKKSGEHRMGQAHFLPLQKSITLQVCRRCGYREFRRPELVGNCIVDRIISTQNPKDAS